MKKTIQQKKDNSTKNLSGRELARLVGVTESFISKSKRDGLLVCGKDGKYDPRHITNAAFIEKTMNTESRRRSIPSSESADTAAVSYTENRNRKMAADADVAEQKAAYYSGKLIPSKFIEHSLLRYIEKLNSNLERYVGAGCDDLAKKILSEGELTNKMREDFLTTALVMMDDTKHQVSNEIKNFDPHSMPFESL